MKRLIAMLLGFMLLNVGVASASAAETTVCSEENQLPPGRYGDVEARDGCYLDARHVIQGSLIVDGRSGLVPEVDGTHIGGDVAVYEAQIARAHIGGSVFFLGGYQAALTDSMVAGDVWTRSGFGFTILSGNDIRGGVILDGAGSDGVIASDNTVGDDFLVNQIAGNFNVDRNRVGGNLRVTDSGIYNFGAQSTVQGNDVGGYFDVSRNRVLVFDEDFRPPPLLVADNVIQQHAAIYNNDALHLFRNSVGGVLFCEDNSSDFAHTGNEAGRYFGAECRE